jgi:hypothetical protein
MYVLSGAVLKYNVLPTTDYADLLLAVLAFAKRHNHVLPDRCEVLVSYYCCCFFSTMSSIVRCVWYNVPTMHWLAR